MIRLSTLVVIASVNTLVAGDEVTLPTPDALHANWEAAGELAELAEKMTASCEVSQEVFRRLSVTQMNWRPPNGTHTPRWNTEHLVGRQLLFFSQIYAAIDPETHRVVDINPAQMPPDYEAAHPEWSGADEAELMRRVNDYVVGFAYLLEDLDLDEQAPGSRWKLRGLLKQMDRHYGEHTANVVKKFELPEWPAE